MWTKQRQDLSLPGKTILKHNLFEAEVNNNASNTKRKLEQWFEVKQECECEYTSRVTRETLTGDIDHESFTAC
jgi:hypothetical protein